MALRKLWPAAILALALAPLLALLARAWHGWSVELLLHLTRTVLPMQLGYSLLVAGTAILFGAALSVGGLCAAGTEFPGARWIRSLLYLPLLLPGWFVATIYHESVGIDGPLGLALVSALSAIERCTGRMDFHRHIYGPVSSLFKHVWPRLGT